MLHNIRRLKSSIRVSLRYKKNKKKGTGPFFMGLSLFFKKGACALFSGSL
jgi:hypothetical protein